MKQHLHEKRGISFRELGALYATREMLRRGLLNHVSGQVGHMPKPHEGEHAFCMLYAHIEDHCGTVTCIGGTMAMVMGMDHGQVHGYVGESSGALRELFYPRQLHSDHWNKITPKRAVRAIDQWLDTGKVDWKHIIKTKA